MSNLLEKTSILLTPTAYDDGKVLSVKPEDGTGDFDFTRNSSATRVNSQGLIEDMQILSSNLVTNGDFSQEGSELITNGDFATDSNWNKLNAIISDGKGSLNGGGVIGSLLYQDILTQNKSYKATFTISNYNGLGEAIIMSNPGVVYYNITANGTFSAYFQHTITDGNFLFRAINGAEYSIDNVSVKEVGQNWTLGSFTSIGNNVANIVNSTGELSLQQNIGVSQKTIKLTYTISNYSSGGIRPQYGAVNGLNRSANGTYTEIITGANVSSDLSFFSVTANTTATISNISVIEITDDTNLPRIDYSPYSGAGTCGHWLFEPQSTNTATYSNDFTQGDIFVLSVDPSLLDTVLTSQQATSPDGTNNAWKMVDNNNGIRGKTGFQYFGVNVITNNYNTISYFVKKQGSNNFVYIATTGFDAGAIGDTWFDIQNGTLGNVSANHTANIQNYGNGWYRISITMQATTDVVGYFALRLATSNGDQGILRDGTNGIYFFGVQAESDANRQFMTSYIPTNGSTVTRLADAAFGSGNSSLINSTEGVLYAEIAALANDSTVRRISLTDGTVNNRVEIAFFGSSNRINVSVKVSGTDTFSSSTSSYDITQFNKIAIKYKVDDFNLFINGVKLSSDTSGLIPTGLNTLNFDSGSGNFNFFGKTKCLAVFKEALTDAELTCLTTI